MFTGLVQAVGRVARREPTPRGLRLVIDPGGWSHRPEVGDSISVSGCCLTLAEPLDGSGRMVFHAVPETLEKTTLGSLREGEGVNLEHSCRADTLMGGHIVQGHVDAVGRVVGLQADPSDWRVQVEPPAELMPYIVPKGSITVEGVSLTIARVDAASFGVALIPTTLEKTTLAGLRLGSPVNLEADTIAKTVVHYLRHYAAKGPA